MDKKGWIIIILCVIGLVANHFHTAKQAEEWRKEQALLAPSTPAQELPVPGPDGTTPAKPAPVGQLENLKMPETFNEEETEFFVTAENPKHNILFVFTNRGGGIKRVEFPGDNIHANGGGPIIMNANLERAIGALSDAVNRVETGEYKLIAKNDQCITYEGQTYGGLTAVKTYSLKPAQKGGLPILEMSLVLRNPQAIEVNTDSWYLFVGSAAPLLADEVEAQTGVAWLGGTDAKFRPETEFKGGMFSSAKALLQDQVENLQWFGVINQYYSLLVVPDIKTTRSWWAMPVNLDVPGRKAGEIKNRMGVQAALSLGAGVVAPAAETGVKWDIFAGPKIYDSLKRTSPELEQVLLYSKMPVFGWMAGPFSKLLNWALHRIKSVVPDFGIAIIILTIIIRTCIWPLHAKAQTTMKRMSLLNPVLTEIRTKYESDPNRMNQEMMKVYKDYGINPLGGCLPILLQMPIFFGFYGMLMNASELRHESFLWVKDLSQPDTLFHLPDALFGLPINILPLLMGVTMILQMRMTPQTGDKMQQRIFAFMPLIFLFICYNFAAALSLYWTTQNLFSIGQSWWMKRQPEVTLEKRQKKAVVAAPGMDNERRRMMGLPPEKEKKTGKPKPPRTGG